MITEVEVLCTAEMSSIGVEEKKLTFTSSFFDLKTWAFMLEYPAVKSATMAMIFFPLYFYRINYSILVVFYC